MILVLELKRNLVLAERWLKMVNDMPDEDEVGHFNFKSYKNL